MIRIGSPRLIDAKAIFVHKAMHFCYVDSHPPGSARRAPALRFEEHRVIGRTVSHYRILSELGSGGMGVVYRAEDLSLGRLVAVKFLSAQLSADPDARRRFVHEARAAAALDHSGICTVYDTGEAEGQPFIAMALVEGETLRDRIAKGPLPIPEALRIALQVAEALQEAHGKGVVHRDVKPANIMLTLKGQARVMDFGLAQLSGASQLTRSGSTMGTAAYLSPEQARGEGADRRTDLWSLGVVLYEMVCGRRPFQGEHAAALLHGIQHLEPLPLTGLRTGVPIETEKVVGKCLAKEAGQRYQHADELAVDLRRLLMHLDATQTVPRLLPPRPTSRRWLMAAGALVVIGAAAWMFVPRLLPRSLDRRSMALAVIDFRDLSTPDDLTVSAGMSALLQVGLVEDSPVRVISPEYLLDIRRRLFRASRGPIADDQALQVARKAGATLLLCGQMTQQGKNCTVMWRLVDTSDGNSLLARRAEGEVLTVIADRIISDVLPALARPGETADSRPGVPSSTEAFTTASPVAYRHFMTGQMHVEGLRYQAAIEEFRLAAQIDTTFALATFWLCRAIDGLNGNARTPEALASVERAWRHRDRLNTADRMRLTAWRMRLDRGPLTNEETNREFEKILARWPDDRLSLRDLAMSFVWSWCFDKAEPLLLRAVALYPDDLHFATTLVAVQVFRGKASDAAATGRRYVFRNPDEADAWASLGWSQLFAGFPDSATLSYTRAAALGYSEPLTELAFMRGDLDSAIMIARDAAARPGLSTQELLMRLAVAGRGSLAFVLGEAGRFREAFAVYDQVEGLEAIPGYWRRCLLLLELNRPGEALARLDKSARLVPSADGRPRVLNWRPRALALMDSMPQARAALAAFGESHELSMVDVSGWSRMAFLLDSAYVALTENKFAAALDDLFTLAGIGMTGSDADIDYRELLARAYRLAGRLGEAAQVHEDLLRLYGGHALSHYELGRIYEEMKRPLDARREYERFLVLWAKADADAPQLLDARRRLSALGGSGGKPDRNRTALSRR